jgi:UDP-glucose:(glucosyl)LPS alpha-1,2-glucosyltransferase
MTAPGIAILLPYAEHFGPDGGAVALGVRYLTAGSRYRAVTRIYGRPTERPYPGFDFRPREPAWPLLLGHNLGLAEQVRRELPDRHDCLLEIHNRPNMFHYLARRTHRLPLVLVLGNDPHTMRKAKTPAERARIVSRASAIICVSDYVRRRFAEGLKTGHEKLRVIHNAIPRTLERPPPKEKLILFAGRIVEDKGVSELVGALERVLPRHPDWRAEIIGASRFGSSRPVTPYEQSIRERCAGLGPQVRCLGFIANDQLMAHVARAEIMVVPSICAEALSRTAIEGLAYGCAVVAFARGGLPEVVEGRGLLIEDASADALAEGLERLIGNAELRQQLQRRAWQDYPFEVEPLTARLDGLRDEVLARAQRSGR